jgi:hypothetical protein
VKEHEMVLRCVLGNAFPNLRSLTLNGTPLALLAAWLRPAVFARWLDGITDLTLMDIQLDAGGEADADGFEEMLPLLTSLPRLARIRFERVAGIPDSAIGAFCLLLAGWSGVAPPDSGADGIMDALKSQAHHVAGVPLGAKGIESIAFRHCHIPRAEVFLLNIHLRACPCLATLDLRGSTGVDDMFLMPLIPELMAFLDDPGHPPPHRLRELRLEGTGVTDKGAANVAKLYTMFGPENFPNLCLLGLPARISPGVRRRLAAATAGGLLRVVYG